MRIKLAPKIVPRILSMALVLVTIFTILPQQAYASDGFSPVSGGAAAGGISKLGSPTAGTTNGVWIEDRQGYRVTVVDHAGAPAFTFGDKDSIDIIFTDGRKFQEMDFYVDGVKTNNGAGTIKNSIEAMNTKVYTFQVLRTCLKQADGVH